ncbi:hypothetical protein RJ639_025087 [Escallonia herrerae]|uniref:ENTH domain-containing protein n=1 Tax=Escallonia herrerae TaxID=1293975 RepID=A0AA89ABV3_9ASTE|nr:hypothetical protein RJ639_025087 [Escallonia herrerae]
MSILGSSSNNMATPSFHEFKKQASFFFKEKIKNARLALTDVTSAQLLTEEATNGNPGAPDTRTLTIISRAAFEVDDFWRIVEILHKRFERFDKKNWRLSYQALIVLEHLMTHGPESVAEEFQSVKDVISEMGSFQHIDEKGFNWGLNVRKKSERITKLLDEGFLLKEERNRARKLSRGIQGFGSFCHRASSTQGILQESSFATFGRCNSQFNDHGNQENQLLNMNEEEIRTKLDENVKSRDIFSDCERAENFGTQTSFKENMAPKKEDPTGESNPLLCGHKDDIRNAVVIEADHPFNEAEPLATVSLLSATDQTLRAC